MEVCYVTMARQEAQAKWERLHNDERGAWHDGTHSSWSKKPSSSHPYHRDHGVTIWVAGTDLGMGGEFLGSDALDRVDEVERDEPEDQDDQ